MATCCRGTEHPSGGPRILPRNSLGLFDRPTGREAYPGAPLSLWQPRAPSPLRPGRLLLPVPLSWQEPELCRLEPVNKPERAHCSRPGNGEQEVGERRLPEWKNTG